MNTRDVPFRETRHEGQFVRYEDGTRHGPVALDEGPPCILFATVERGVDVDAREG